MSIDWKQKYLEITNDFLNQLKRNPDHAIQGLSFYVENRSNLLKIINLKEKKIDIPILHPTESDTDFINKLVELDSKILTLLEQNKSKCSEQIASLVKNQKMISTYHSAQNEAQYLDKKL